MTQEAHRQVLEYWFDVLEPADWFKVSADVDAAISERFGGLHLALSRQCGAEWTERPEACLSAIIVFDQFSRNMYRGSPLAFATDCLALALARDAVAKGMDAAVPEERRAFFYLPFEHSEHMADQDRSVELFAALGNPLYLDYAERHRDVIRRFGRFPHRNPILMRASTPEEEVYLATPGSGF